MSTLLLSTKKAERPFWWSAHCAGELKKHSFFKPLPPVSGGIKIVGQFFKKCQNGTFGDLLKVFDLQDTFFKKRCFL